LPVSPTVPAMRRARISILWLLAVLWLPATLHCAIEEAGWFDYDDSCCSKHPADSSPSAEHCDKDACQVLESGLIKPADSLVKVRAPEFSAIMELVWLIACDPPGRSRVAPETTDSPPELPRTWQFTARAAHSPRGPDLHS